MNNSHTLSLVANGFSLSKYNKPATPTDEYDSLYRLATLTNCENTRYSLRTNLNRFISWVKVQTATEAYQDINIFTFPYHLLVRSDIIAYYEDLMTSGYKVSTIKAYIWSIRRILKEAVKADQLDPDTYVGMFNFVMPDTSAAVFQQYEKLSSPTVTDEHYLKVMTANFGHDNLSIRDLRDRMFYAWLFYTGVRAHELRHLRIENVRLDAELPFAAFINAKGMRSYCTSLNSQIVAFTREYLEAVGNYTQGYLFSFLTLSRGPEIERILSRSAITVLLKRLSRKANAQYVSSHKYRSSKVERMFDKSIDSATIAASVGHRRIETTLMYDKRLPKRIHAFTEGEVVDV